jgi:hypothetical protein
MGSCQSVPVSGNYSPPTTPAGVDPLWEGKFELTIYIGGKHVNLVVKPADTVESVLKKLSAFSGWFDKSRLYCNEQGIVLSPQKTLEEYGITNKCHGLTLGY